MKKILKKETDHTTIRFANSELASMAPYIALQMQHQRKDFVSECLTITCYTD